MSRIHRETEAPNNQSAGSHRARSANRRGAAGSGRTVVSRREPARPGANVSTPAGTSVTRSTGTALETDTKRKLHEGAITLSGGVTAAQKSADASTQWRTAAERPRS